jgi:hypothetical protein
MSTTNFTIKKRFNLQRDEHQRNNYLNFAKQTILDKNTDVLIYPFNSSEWFNYVAPYLFRQENKKITHSWIKHTILKNNFENRSYTFSGDVVGKLWGEYNLEQSLWFGLSKIYKFMIDPPKDFIVPISMGAIVKNELTPQGHLMDIWYYPYHPGSTKMKCLSFMPRNLNFNIMITRNENTRHLQKLFDERGYTYHSFMNTSNEKLQKLLNLDRMQIPYWLYTDEIGFQMMESDEEIASQDPPDWHVEFRDHCFYVNGFQITENYMDGNNRMYKFVGQHDYLNASCPIQKYQCPFNK